MSAAVYLDHNATTVMDPRVLDAMLPHLGQPVNPTSRHGFGRAARHAINMAREQVAVAVGAHPSQVTFTSGGTEADNLAIKGIADTHTPSQIIVSAIEHPAVLKSAQALRWNGWQVTTTGVNVDGQLDLDQLQTALKQQSALVSVMTANNETGVLQDIAAIAELTKQRGALLHTDAVQALGKIPLDFNALGLHAMSVSGHKIHGPQGIGALILDKHVDIQCLQIGGGQERGLRSGTENVAAIVGFGLACELAMRELPQQATSLTSLQIQLENGLMDLGATIFGSRAPRLPNTSFFAFSDIDGETLVMALDRQGFFVASGSACSSDSVEPSHVLLAMGVTPDLARGAVRVSLGRDNTVAQVADFLLTLRMELTRMKRMTALAV